MLKVVGYDQKSGVVFYEVRAGIFSIDGRVVSMPFVSVKPVE